MRMFVVAAAVALTAAGCTIGPSREYSQNPTCSGLFDKADIDYCSAQEAKAFHEQLDANERADAQYRASHGGISKENQKLMDQVAKDPVLKAKTARQSVDEIVNEMNANEAGYAAARAINNAADSAALCAALSPDAFTYYLCAKQ